MSSKPIRTGRQTSAWKLRARSAGLCLGIAWSATTADAQTLTSDMLRPVRDGVSVASDLRLRRATEPGDAPAPSRIGAPLVYGAPAGSGASDTGFDSLNRKRAAKKPYPGAPKPRVSPGPASPPPVFPPPPLTIPPSSLANKPPLAPALAGTVAGQPPRKRLRPDLDPFGAVGDYAGSFLVKSAIEVSAGYDSNPGRFTTPRGSAFYVVAPELLVVSDWTRHALVADLRGSFTSYGSTFPAQNSGDPSLTGISGVPTNVDRPDFNGKIHGRLDVSHDTHILSELRLRVATDNPGSPNIQAGLQKYPLFAAPGVSLGVEQDFNRLSLAAVGSYDRVDFQDSLLTNGVSTTNIDRNFDQYGGVARAGYEILPGLKPFGEVGGDTRIHDVHVDRFGYQRDSNSVYGKIGSTFEFTRLITGEASIGYGARAYQDPRLANLNGLLTSASIAWAVTPLTTVRALSTTSLDETTLPGASGVLVRTYTAEVDHDFRRWLTAIGRFTYGTLDYQGGNRLDTIYSVSGDLVYKLNRSFQIKAQIRRDQLDSSLPGASTVSNVVMLGVRAQN